MIQVFMKKPAQNRAGFYFELESSIIFSNSPKKFIRIKKN